MPKATTDSPKTLVDTQVEKPKAMVVEENPTADVTPVTRTVEITEEENDVLLRVLDRERTARLSHGGLKGILGLTDDQARALLGFLRKI